MNPLPQLRRATQRILFELQPRHLPDGGNAVDTEAEIAAAFASVVYARQVGKPDWLKAHVERLLRAIRQADALEVPLPRMHDPGWPTLWEDAVVCSRLDHRVRMWRAMHTDRPSGLTGEEWCALFRTYRALGLFGDTP
ncbi:MAG: hypothetical protein JNM56_29080 [Planctomycetia bacterium]|nr:hypothetical protein [Planctomycetia bacterium]